MNDISRENPPAFDIPDIGTGRAEITWPPSVSARALCEDPPVTPPALVEGMLYQGGTMLLSGPSKAMKSFTLIDAAVSNAYGTEWLGIKTAQCPVLYLNFELQDFAIASRILNVARAKDLLPPKDLHILTLRHVVTSILDLERHLPARIREVAAGAVIIDPHYKLSAVSGAEENSSEGQADLLSHLEALCGANDAAVILAHHFAKGAAARKNQIDRASGSGVFARWPDVFMTLTEHREEAAMTFEFTLRNFAAIPPFVARWEYPLWRRDGALNAEDLKKSGATEQYTAEEALEKLSAEGMRYSEWRAASRMTESTFRRKRDQLLSDNKVIRKGNLYYPVRAAPVTFGCSQNRQNSQFNRHNCATTASETPPAIILKDGGGDCGVTEGSPIPTGKSEEISPAAVTSPAVPEDELLCATHSAERV